MRLLPVLAVALGATLSTACGLTAQTATPSAAVPVTAPLSQLRRTLDSIADAHRGVVGYSITNLETKEHLVKNDRWAFNFRFRNDERINFSIG